jgi:N4-gp56 family major capsid protein
MTDWGIETGDATTRKSWEKRYWIEAKTENFFASHGLEGESYNDNVIVEIGDLDKEQGDEVTWGQLRNITGVGIQGDNDVEGFEVSPDVYDDKITLDLWRQAIRTKGLLSEQRKSDKETDKEVTELLARWLGAKIDQDIFDAAGTALTKVLYGGTATSTLTMEAGFYFILSLISKATAYSIKATPKIVGPRIGGMKTKGIVIVSPDQKYDITERDASWGQAMREAEVAGKNNPIFTGALGMKDSVPIYEHERVAIATNWGAGSDVNGATALFMGVSAIGIAWVRRKIWETKTFQYNSKRGWCTGAMFGLTKAVMNSLDLAVIGIRTSRTNN